MTLTYLVLQVIWNCLVEDSSLFLRYILERLTRDKQELMFKILRHLIRFVPKLPQQAAFALYNYIIGYVMFYVRSPHENGQKMIGAALSILWMVGIVLLRISRLTSVGTASNERLTILDACLVSTGCAQCSRHHVQGPEANIA